MKNRGTGEERLAARYWELLDFYPTWFREQRGAELVGTLLDCARPGQTRPTRREARALMIEGLRLRAGTGVHRPARETLAGGVLLGLLVLLIGITVEGLTTLGTARGYDDVRPVTAGWCLLVGLALLACVVPVVLVARGRVRVALPFVAVAGAVHMVGFPWLHRTGWTLVEPPGADWPGVLPLPLNPGVATVAVLAAAALAWLGPRVASARTVALAAAASMLVWAPVDWLDAVGLPSEVVSFLGGPLLMLVLPLVYLGVLAYATVDARPVVALAVLLAVMVVESVAAFLKIGPATSTVVIIVAVVAPVAIAAWLGVRRQDRLPARDMAT